MRKRLSTTALLLLLTLLSVSGQETQKRNITVQKYVAPEYPTLAKQARIAGGVTLLLRINADGTVASVEAETGHAILQKPAEDNVKQWRFHCFPCSGAFQHRITYRYQISDESRIDYKFPDYVSISILDEDAVYTTKDPACWKSAAWYHYLIPWHWHRIRWNTRGYQPCRKTQRTD